VLKGVHSSGEGGGEAQAHAPLGVRLRAGHLVLNVQVPEHLLLLLQGLQTLLVDWLGGLALLLILMEQSQ